MVVTGNEPALILWILGFSTRTRSRIREISKYQEPTLDAQQCSSLRCRLCASSWLESNHFPGVIDIPVAVLVV